MRGVKAMAAAILLSAFGAAGAHADDKFLFAYNAEPWLLTLNGATTVQSADTGWTDQARFHLGINESYFVGLCDQSCATPSIARNWGRFDLSGLATEPVTSATLRVRLFGRTTAEPITWSLFDVATGVAALDADRSAGDATGLAIFDDLGSGAAFGERTFSVAELGSIGFADYIDISLNGAAIAAINARGQFVVGGSLGDLALPMGPAVPEPAQWLLLIAGFGLTGGAMRRRVRAPHRQSSSRHLA